MSKRLKRLLFLWMILEVVTVFIGIIENVSPEGILLGIAISSGLWVLYILSVIWVESLVKRKNEV